MKKNLGNIKEHKLFVRLAAIVLFVIAICAYVGCAVFLQLAFQLSPVLATTVSNIITSVVCACIYFRFYHEKGCQTDASTDKITVQILLSIAVSFCILIIFSWIAIYFPDPTMDGRTESILAGDSVQLYIITSCLLSPVSEEFILRLFLYNMLKRRFKWTTSMVITSVVFALMHGTLSHLILASFFGIMMITLYEITGKWYISIIAHTVYNVMAVALNDFVTYAASYTLLFILCIIIAAVIITRQVVLVSLKYNSIKR